MHLSPEIRLLLQWTRRLSDTSIGIKICAPAVVVVGSVLLYWVQDYRAHPLLP